MRQLLLCGFLLISSASVGSQVYAKNVLLIIGGGPDPTSNQWSLQRNVEFACRTVSSTEAAAEPWEIQIYFADGPAKACDVQRKVADRPENKAAWWLALLANGSSHPVMEYVNHSFPQGSQAASKDNLQRGFKKLADSLGKDDRLFVYVTAHGGPAETGEYYGGAPSDDVNRFNTTLALWGNDTVDAAEFSQWLDHFEPEVEITLVMTQCYSGGFASVLFHNADRKQGLNNRPRCGFFSQRHDRVAAGCTPEIDESAYEEYSSSFWAAIGGLDRLGQPAKPVDYDGDRRISFEEAHAYTVINSQTLDIPLRSSDVILRRYSKIGAPLEEQAESDEPPSGGFFGRLFGGDEPAAQTEVRDLPKLRMTTGSSLEELASAGRLPQRAILESLAKELEVEISATLKEVRDRRGEVKRGVDRVRQRQARVYSRLTDSIDQLEKVVHERWPQLGEAAVTYALFELGSERADELVRFIDSKPAANAIEKRIEELKSLEGQVSTEEVKEARWQRLVHIAEVIALQTNLPDHAPQDAIEQYQRVLALEQRGLSP